MPKMMSENSIGARIFSATSYLTAGVGGIVIFFILYFAKIKPSKYFQFNLYQSVFISFALAILGMGYNIIYDIFTKIPIIKLLMTFIDLTLNKPLILGYSLFQFVILLYMIYVVGCSILGKYPIIYKISKLIDNTIR